MVCSGSLGSLGSLLTLSLSHSAFLFLRFLCALFFSGFRCPSPLLRVPLLVRSLLCVRYALSTHYPLSPVPCPLFFLWEEGGEVHHPCAGLFFFRDLPIGVVRDEPKHLETLGTPD